MVSFVLNAASFGVLFLVSHKTNINTIGAATRELNQGVFKAPWFIPWWLNSKRPFLAQFNTTID
ncbi:hypothetical protein, partial [Desulfatiferula olefinivorans]